MQKNATKAKFIIAASKCSVKQTSKVVRTALKLTQKQIKQNKQIQDTAISIITTDFSALCCGGLFFGWFTFYNTLVSLSNCRLTL